MIIKLKGRIKNLVKDFGFIHHAETKTDYFFHQTKVDGDFVYSIGELVSFTSRPN